MTVPYGGELIFEVTGEADVGFVAECLSENTCTPGDSSNALRANVRDGVKTYFFDGPRPRAIRLPLVLDELLQMK